MPGRRHIDEDSSSSSSSRSSGHSGRSRRVKYEGSSCGIRSVNEYYNRTLDYDETTASVSKERSDGRAWAQARATDHENGALSAAASAGAAALKDEKLGAEALRARAGADAQFGFGGVLAEGEAEVTYLGFSDDQASVDFISGNVGGGVGIGAGGAKAKVEAGVDLVKTEVSLGKHQSVSGNLGVNADTGGEVGVDGVSLKILGLGVSAGRNTGIHTPFGSISFKLW